MSQDKCIQCGAKLRNATGIGPYCPNEDCDRIDDQQPAPLVEPFEKLEQLVESPKARECLEEMAEAVHEAPKYLYLNPHDPDEDETHHHEYWEDATWSEDPAEEGAVKYIRADLQVTAPSKSPGEVQEEIKGPDYKALWIAMSEEGSRLVARNIELESELLSIRQNQAPITAISPPDLKKLRCFMEEVARRKNTVEEEDLVEAADAWIEEIDKSQPPAPLGSQGGEA